MDTFIGHLMEEIDESRSQMFDILENIAYYEAKSDPKKFAKTKKTATKVVVPVPTAQKPRRLSIMKVKEIVFPMKNNAPSKKKGRISKEMSSTMETIQNNADSGSDDLMRSNSIQPRKKSSMTEDSLGIIGRSKSRNSGHADILTFETDEKGLDN